MPVSDAELVNFRSEKQIIDLWSAALAWELAAADWLLNVKIEVMEPEPVHR